jgi:hypothetical protein
MQLLRIPFYHFHLKKACYYLYTRAEIRLLHYQNEDSVYKKQAPATQQF